MIDERIATLRDVNQQNAPSFEIAAGRVWTGSLFVMFGLALVGAMALAVLDRGPVSIALLGFVVLLSALTAWRGWGRICDQLTITETGLTLRTIWPRGFVPLEQAAVARVWLSPNSGTIRFFTENSSYVLRIRGDLINWDLEQLLVKHSSHGALSHHYNKTLW